jgi:hypothetical protein
MRPHPVDRVLGDAALSAAIAAAAPLSATLGFLILYRPYYAAAGAWTAPLLVAAAMGAAAAACAACAALWLGVRQRDEAAPQIRRPVVDASADPLVAPARFWRRVRKLAYHGGIGIGVSFVWVGFVYPELDDTRVLYTPGFWPFASPTAVAAFLIVGHVRSVGRVRRALAPFLLVLVVSYVLVLAVAFAVESLPPPRWWIPATELGIALGGGSIAVLVRSPEAERALREADEERARKRRAAAEASQAREAERAKVHRLTRRAQRAQDRRKAR